MPPEVIAGHVFDLVRFVEYDRRILRQNAAKIVLAQRQVGEKQMMIDDDHIRVGGPPVHRRNEASLELHAFLPGASFAPGVQPRPQVRLVGQKAQFRPVAGLGQAPPVANLANQSSLFQAPQYRLPLHLVNLMPAEEVRAAFHHRYFQFGGKMLLHKRHIFGVELFLQRLGRRGDHHAAPTANGGYQIGQRLARSRSCFHQQMSLFAEGVLDQLGHANCERRCS